MTVYVDDMKAQYGRMVMCHMIADSTEELNNMAGSIGVSERWIQNFGTWKEHYDISLTKRKLAIDAGAKEVTMGQLSQMLRRRRG